MPYYPDVTGAPQNSIIGGASLWVMGGKKPEEYKGVAKFFAFLSDTDRQVKLHQESGYLPITKAAYEKTKASGFYEKNPTLETPLKELTNKEPTENSRGLRFGNMVQMRDVWAEEMEAALAGQKTAQQALDAAVTRGNAMLRRLKRTAVSDGSQRHEIVAATALLVPRSIQAKHSWKTGDLQQQAAALRAARAAAHHYPDIFLLAGRQAVWQSFLVRMPSACRRNSSAWRTTSALFAQPEYYKAMATTLVFSSLVAVLSLSLALLFATQADKNLKAAQVYKTFLIWPYAVAPAVAGVLWFFMFHPSLGTLARPLRWMGFDWNPVLNGNHAMILVVMAAVWKQISYNFLFFLAGLQSIPKSVIEAGAIDGAGPMRRFWTIVFPLLSPTTFFLLVVNVVYVFFDTFGIIDAVTGGGPTGATTTMVYKVYADGRLGGDLGGSAAQSVVLMVIVIALTAFQFRYVERRVQY